MAGKGNQLHSVISTTKISFATEHYKDKFSSTTKISFANER